MYSLHRVTWHFGVELCGRDWRGNISIEERMSLQHPKHRLHVHKVQAVRLIICIICHIHGYQSGRACIPTTHSYLNTVCSCLMGMATGTRMRRCPHLEHCRCVSFLGFYKGRVHEDEYFRLGAFAFK